MFTLCSSPLPFISANNVLTIDIPCVYLFAVRQAPPFIVAGKCNKQATALGVWEPLEDVLSVASEITIFGTLSRSAIGPQSSMPMCRLARLPAPRLLINRCFGPFKSLTPNFSLAQSKAVLTRVVEIGE